MFEPKIKIPKDLFERAKAAAEASGCASLEEFAEHALEREIERVEKTSQGDADAAKRRKEADDITSKLQGLGYID